MQQCHSGKSIKFDEPRPTWYDAASDFVSVFIQRPHAPPAEHTAVHSAVDVQYVALLEAELAFVLRLVVAVGTDVQRVARLLSDLVVF